MARRFASASSQYLASGAISNPGLPITMFSWVRPVSGAATQRVWSYSQSGAIEIRGVYFDVVDRVSIQEYSDAAGGVDGSASTSATISLGTWIPVMAVFASNVSRGLYALGQVVSSSINVVAAGLNLLTIGRRQDNASQYLDADIAEFAVWNVALSATDYASLSAGVSPLLVRPESLIRYHPLGGQYSPEIDLIGRSDLTVTGATASAHTRMFLAHQSLPPVRTYRLTGVTRSGSGLTLAGATVNLFRTSDNAFMGTTVSDGAGNYFFNVTSPGNYFAIAYKAGSPDITGATLNTLQGV